MAYNKSKAKGSAYEQKIATLLAVREAEVMKKKPLLLFRWDRSKDFAAYDDNTEVEDYVEISSFGHKFKISRLDDWIKAVKKADKLPKYREEK